MSVYAETIFQDVFKLIAENDRLRSELAQAREARDMLTKGIVEYLDGDHGPRLTAPQDKCPHGLYRHETCECCVDEHFEAVLARLTPQDKAAE